MTVLLLVTGLWLGGFILTSARYKHCHLPKHVLISLPGLCFIFLVWPLIAWDMAWGTP